jgi:hypothetical protein
MSIILVRPARSRAFRARTESGRVAMGVSARMAARVSSLTRSCAVSSVPSSAAELSTLFVDF